MIVIVLLLDREGVGRDTLFVCISARILAGVEDDVQGATVHASLRVPTKSHACTYQGWYACMHACMHAQTDDIYMCTGGQPHPSQMEDEGHKDAKQDG